MSNVVRRATEEHPVAISREADPFRWMRQMMGWDPFREMAPSFAASPQTFSPAFEVKENADAFTFKADLPGMKDKDVEVKLTGNRLTITGKREEEKQNKGDTFYTYERSYGSFLRAFTLPEGIDSEHVQAELKEGVLTVAIPKKASSPGKTITIKSSEQSKS